MKTSLLNNLEMKGACVNKGRLKGIIACNGLLLVCRLRAGRHSHFPTARRRREAAEAAEGAHNCFINLIWHACVSRTRTNQTLVFKNQKSAAGCRGSSVECFSARRRGREKKKKIPHTSGIKAKVKRISIRGSRRRRQRVFAALCRPLQQHPLPGQSHQPDRGSSLHHPQGEHRGPPEGVPGCKAAHTHTHRRLFRLDSANDLLGSPIRKRKKKPPISIPLLAFEGRTSATVNSQTADELNLSLLNGPRREFHHTYEDRLFCLVVESNRHIIIVILPLFNTSAQRRDYSI